MNTTSMTLAIIAVVGTILGVLITQFFQGRQMRMQLDYVREQWIRDRRADLYVRITSLYRETQGVINSSRSIIVETASIIDQLEANAFKQKEIFARSVILSNERRKSGESYAILAERASLLASDREQADLESKELNSKKKRLDAESKELVSKKKRLDADSEQADLESKELDSKKKRLDADREAYLPRSSDIISRLNDQKMALEVLGSQKVRSLANKVLGEIANAWDAVIETREPRELDYRSWEQLNNAMREDLKIVD